MVCSYGADFHNEHHRVAQHQARIQFCNGIPQRAPEQAGIDKRIGSRLRLAVIEDLKRLSGKHQKMFKNWSETQDWKKRQSSTITTVDTMQCVKSGVRYRKRAGGFRNGFFASKASRQSPKSE